MRIFYKEEGYREKVNFVDEDNYDYKNYVRFRLCCGDGRKFLTLYNFHNGYYSKGFKMIDDKSITIKEGDI